MNTLHVPSNHLKYEYNKTLRISLHKSDTVIHFQACKEK